MEQNKQEGRKVQRSWVDSGKKRKMERKRIDTNLPEREKRISREV